METKKGRDLKEREAPIVRYLHARAAKNETCASATFEITSRCNFNCKMCYVHNSDCNARAHEELSVAQWTEIARQAAEAGIMFVLITGGEPLIRPDFAEIYTMLIKTGFVVSVNSNLSLITPAHLALFRQYPPNRINASLYGVSDETYAELCGVPAFGKVSSAIEELRKIGVPVKINSSVTPFNCRDFEGIHDYCRQKDLVLATASYMFPAARLGDNKERLTPEDAALYRVKGDAIELSREDFLARVEKVEKGTEYIRSGDCIDPRIKNCGVQCRAGTSSVWVDYKGNLSMCGMVPAGQDMNVLQNGFDACCRAIREKVKAIVLPHKCTECAYRYLCNVCAAACFSETGEFGKVPDYICRMSAATAEYFAQYAQKIKAGETNEG